MFKLIGAPPLGRRFRLIGGAASETPGSGVTDTFTVGSDIALGSYTGPMGTWVRNYAGDTPTASIAAATGRARSNSTTSSTVYRVGSMSGFTGAEYKSKAIIIFTSASLGGVGVRTNSTDRTGYYAYYSSTAGGLVFARSSANGTATQLGATVSITAPTVGVAWTIELQARGTGATVTLEAWVNGVSVGTVSDSDAARVTTQGYAAMYLVRQAAEFDSFTVTQA